MPYFLNALYIAKALLLLPFSLYRMVTAGEYVESFWSRLIGRSPRRSDERDVLWFHGSSIGEILLLRPLIDRVCSIEPKLQIILSTDTSDGLRAAEKAFPTAASFYVPFDMSWAVRRAYTALQPRMLVLSELELWPNLLLEAKRRGIPVAVVSSRMNDADFRYFTRINRLHRPALTAIQWWGVQTPPDASRIARLLGPSQTRIEVTGSLKFDAAFDERVIASSSELRRTLGFAESDRILVGGSTHAPEEELLLDVLQELENRHIELRLVLVPRLVERSAGLDEQLRRRGIPFSRRSQMTSQAAKAAPVTLIDSVGDLPALWAIADFAFVGGSLARDRGGHNPLEPAALAKPLCFGPNVWNFQSIADGLLEAKGACRVMSKEDLVATIAEWFQNPETASAIGRNAHRYVQSQRGAAAKTMQALMPLLQSAKGKVTAERIVVEP